MPNLYFSFKAYGASNNVGASLGLIPEHILQTLNDESTQINNVNFSVDDALISQVYEFAQNNPYWEHITYDNELSIEWKTKFDNLKFSLMDMDDDASESSESIEQVSLIDIDDAFISNNETKLILKRNTQIRHLPQTLPQSVNTLVLNHVSTPKTLDYVLANPNLINQITTIELVNSWSKRLNLISAIKTHKNIKHLVLNQLARSICRSFTKDQRRLLDNIETISFNNTKQLEPRVVPTLKRVIKDVNDFRIVKKKPGPLLQLFINGKLIEVSQSTKRQRDTRRYNANRLKRNKFDEMDISNLAASDSNSISQNFTHNLSSLSLAKRQMYEVLLLSCSNPYAISLIKFGMLLDKEVLDKRTLALSSAQNEISFAVRIAELFQDSNFDKKSFLQVAETLSFLDVNMSMSEGYLEKFKLFSLAADCIESINDLSQGVQLNQANNPNTFFNSNQGSNIDREIPRNPNNNNIGIKPN